MRRVLLLFGAAATVLILAAALVGATGTYAYATATSHNTAQLLWNANDGYLFISSSRLGWKRTPLGFMRDYALTHLSIFGSIEPTERRRDLVVITFGREGISRHTLSVELPGDYYVFQNQIYGYGTQHSGLERWAGTHFEPTTPSEAARFAPEAGRVANFSDVSGWSSRSGVLHREPGPTTFDVLVGGAKWTVTAHNYWTSERWKAIDIKPENGQSERVWSISQDYRRVTAAEYASFLKQE